MSATQHRRSRSGQTPAGCCSWPRSTTWTRGSPPSRTSYAVGGQIVGQAVARGELPAGTDPDLAVDLMIGPLYWRLAVARTPIDDDYLEKLSAAVIAALKAGTAAP